MSFRRAFVVAALALVAPHALAEGTFIAAPGRIDFVSNGNDTLYVTSGDQVLAYDLNSDRFLPAYTLGGDLQGIDISYDGSQLAVADASASATELWIWMVDLYTNTAQQIRFPKRPGETGTYSVAFAPDYKVFFTTRNEERSEDVPLRYFDWFTWSVEEVAVPPIGSIYSGAVLALSGDLESFGWTETHDVDGAFGRYGVLDQSVRRQIVPNGTSAPSSQVGVNVDGSQLAIAGGSGLTVVDGDLATLAVLGEAFGPRPAGVVYHPVEPLAYLPWATTDEVRVVETAGFTQVGSYDAETVFPVEGDRAFRSGRARISSDGSLLFVEVDGGIRYFRQYAPFTAPERLDVYGLPGEPVPVAFEASIGNGGELHYVAHPPLYGSLEGTPPNVTYIPNAEWAFGDLFAYTVSYGRVSRTVQVEVHIQRTNQPPAATDQSVEVDEDTSSQILLEATDDRVTELAAVVTEGASHGTLAWPDALAPDYTPNANFTGTDTFVYHLDDGEFQTAPARVTISVRPVNDAPTATAQSLSTLEDTPKAIALAGADVEGASLSFSIVGGPSHGTLSGSAPNLTYLPGAQFSGFDLFSFRVNDGELDSAPVDVFITVTAVNDVPTANAQSVSTAEDTARAIVLTGSDVEGSALTFTIASNPTRGTLSGSGANRTYTPSVDSSGSDSFTFTVSDGSAASSPATVSIVVTPVNDPPTAVNDTATTKKNTSVTILVLANDSDVDLDSLTVSATTAPTKGGSVTILAGATNVRYTPKPNFTGTDTFTYTASDGRGGTRTATATVTVTKN